MKETERRELGGRREFMLRACAIDPRLRMRYLGVVVSLSLKTRAYEVRWSTTDALAGMRERQEAHKAHYCMQSMTNPVNPADQEHGKAIGDICLGLLLILIDLTCAAKQDRRLLSRHDR
jgi:hypothetical protein